MAAFDTAKIGAALKKVPWWGYAGGGGVVLALGYYIHKNATAGTTAASTQASVGSTATPDAGMQLADLAGLPYETFDPGYNSDPYSGYNPYTTPPSGSPPTEPPTPAPFAGDTGQPGQIIAQGPGGTQIHNPPADDPGTLYHPPNPNPIPVDAGVVTPTGGSSGDYTHMFHAWPAWDSTLSGVANREGMTWQGLYSFDGNKAIIDAEAHAHGHYSAEYNWVFPDETIHVPHPLPSS